MILFEAKHYGEVEGWWRARKAAIPPLKALPALGYFVPGVAAGWLCETNSSFCLIEELVSNPAVPLEVRELAIHQIIAELIDSARDLGFEKILGFTPVPKIMEYAKAHEFQDLGEYRLMARGL